MALNIDNVEGGSFKWTQYEKTFCEILVQYSMKNGCGEFKWKDISQEFEANTKVKVSSVACKNKYDSMKRLWKTWKFLVFKETGLGWDPVIGRLSCSNEWWEKKIKVSLFLILLQLIFL